MAFYIYPVMQVARQHDRLYLDAFDHDAVKVMDLNERYQRTGVSNQELKDRLTVVTYLVSHNFTLLKKTTFTISAEII